LFGQAGLLELSGGDDYYQLLQQEYRFLQQKYSLTQPDYGLIKNLRILPNGSPHLRIAQLAAVWSKNDTLFSHILDDCRLETLKDCFYVALSNYWDTHYHLRMQIRNKKKKIGLSTIHLILINTIVPMIFAYGRKHQKPDYCTKAIQLFEQIPPEQNLIVAEFKTAGIAIKNAADTQALIQLRREYCEKKNCLHCRIGFELLKK
jgi:hypothetical protein